jgi:electron transfer flavoprotein alpha/beta subunit
MTETLTDPRTCMQVYDAWTNLYMIAGDERLSPALRKLAAEGADRAALFLNEAMDSTAPRADAVGRLLSELG